MIIGHSSQRLWCRWQSLKFDLSSPRIGKESGFNIITREDKTRTAIKDRTSISYGLAGRRSPTTEYEFRSTRNMALNVAIRYSRLYSALVANNLETEIGVEKHTLYVNVYCTRLRSTSNIYTYIHT